MMDVGFVDRVEILGETYQIQTEVVDVTAGLLRTVIAHRGQVVAVNEARLRGAGGGVVDPHGVEDLVSLHHHMILEGFVKRTHGFAERAQAGITPPPPPPAAVQRGGGEALLELGLPPVPEDPAVADGLEVRRLFSELRARVGGGDLAGASRTEALTRRMERTAAALLWLREQPRYARVRIDEQVRVHLLEERIRGWGEHGRNPEEAEWIWTEVVVFCNYVLEINHRADLIVFDRQLAEWALQVIAAGGGVRSTRKPLDWLRGRDEQLDRLLACSDETTADVWRGHLERIWRGLGCATPPTAMPDR